MNLHPVDIAILISYVIGILSLGFILQRRASKGIEEYFLAGRRLHWLVISISASVSTYDITGTMWIVSVMYIMGMKSMWIHWFWGFLIPAAVMTFGAKWVRRSNVITAAEWFVTRFGTRRDTQIARTMYALMVVIFSVGMIGYAFQGIGKFVSVYLPVSERVGACLVMGITAVYVILGGVYSVIFTDVLQTVILSIAAVIVALICFNNISFSELSAAVPDGWLDLRPAWQPDYLQNTDYQFFGLLCIAWVAKGLFIQASAAGTGFDFQRIVSARSARDACKLAAAWPFFLITRWGMCMGITALAWIGFEGVTDAEKVLPYVLHTYLPVGLKGLVLAGFLAAFMSTFDSTINLGASYIVKDFYHALFKPTAANRELAYAGYLASVLIVAAGIFIGFHAESIAAIWNWLQMVLGAGFLVPGVLRWYWWRYNAWGVVASLASGMVLCFAMTVFFPDAPVYVSFFVIVGGSTLVSLITTLLTRPTNQSDLCNFYKTVRPGGFWKPIRESIGVKLEKRDSFVRDTINCGIAMAGIFCLYLIPIYGVIHAWNGMVLCVGVCIVSFLTLTKTWYPYLPRD